MSYTVKGKIISITGVEDLANGAARLSYRIDTGEAYNNIWEFEIYKGSEYVEHAHNFSKFNSVGDSVEVEFNVRPRVWEEKDRVFTTLSHWKCEKLSDTPSEKVEAQETDLPF